MFAQIPVHILEQHEGRWIVWDQDDQRVIGSAETLAEAEEQAQRLDTGHLLRVHHVLPREAEISGML